MCFYIATKILKMSHFCHTKAVLNEQRLPEENPESFCYGGEKEIRTLGTVLGFTRFPVVRTIVLLGFITSRNAVGETLLAVFKIYEPQYNYPFFSSFVTLFAHFIFTTLSITALAFLIKVILL